MAGDWELAAGRAGGWRTLQVSLADIARDTIIGCTSPIETSANSYAASQVAFWNAEVAAAGARSTAEATAVANFRTADYAQTATAVAGIYTAINLPWTGYQADLAAALSTWWVTHERANFLGLAAATNAAETTYQTTVNTAFLAWTSGTAAAERTLATVEANLLYDQSDRDFLAEANHEISLADAEHPWHVDFFTAQRAAAIAVATSHRDFAQDGNAAARDTALAAAIAVRAANNRASDHAHKVSIASAEGIRRTNETTSFWSHTIAHGGAWLDYVDTTGEVERAYAQAYVIAAHTRAEQLAIAVAAHDLAEASTLEAVIEALASGNPTPWASYDRAFANVENLYMQTVAPASRDNVIAEANALRDEALTSMEALYDLITSIALSACTDATSRAIANVTRLTAESSVMVSFAAISTLVPPLSLTYASNDFSNYLKTPLGG